MIKASKFSKECGLSIGDSISQFILPKNHEKSPLYFLSGDVTSYGHKDLKMPEIGYNIIRKSILNQDNHNFLYYDDTQAARQAISKHFSSSNQKIDPNDIFITHGANMGLFYVLLAATNPGDNILVPEPSYPFYHKNGPSLGVEVRPYKLIPEKNWEIDLDYLENIIDERTRFLWIVNPSNPCGSIFSENHMLEIFNFCKKKNIFIVSDEVYWNESFQDHKFISFGHFEQADIPVIVIGGLEKTFLVPGWSFSWLIFFDKNQRLKKIKQGVDAVYSIFLNPCSFVVHAVPELLDTLGANYTKDYMVHFEQNYSYLYQEFLSVKGLQPIQAKGTFYLTVLIKLEHFPQFQNDMQFLQGLLNEENVWILNLSAFKGNYQGFRMLTCATIDGHYKELMKRINKFCDKHYKDK